MALAIALASDGVASAVSEDEAIARHSRALNFGTASDLRDSLAALRARGNPDAAAAMILALRYRRYAAMNLSAALEDIAGHEAFGWFDWMVWQEANPAIKPHPSFTELKLEVLRRLESVREVYVFKHSFLSMRRIDAKSRKARAVLVRFSNSLASRRHLPSQANVLSTTHRLGMTSKPTAVSHRLTISVSKWGKIFFRAWSNTGPWYPPSAKSFSRNGKLPNRVPRTRTPPSRSWILAGCTMACSNRPTVSTRMWCFLPLIFLPAS